VLTSLVLLVILSFFCSLQWNWPIYAPFNSLVFYSRQPLLLISHYLYSLHVSAVICVFAMCCWLLPKKRN
jgi:hypothetical protein